jgi:hypothetical protein
MIACTDSDTLAHTHTYTHKHNAHTHTLPVSASRGVRGGCFSVEVLDGVSVYQGGVRNGVESFSLNLSSNNWISRGSSGSGGGVKMV